MVVIVPAPAITGKAKGTIEAALLADISSDLKMFLPKVISKPIKKIMIAPAMAKELISTPKRFKIDFPTYRKAIIMPPETKVACSAWMCPVFLRRSIITGMAPKMSITENNISDTEIISLKFNCIFKVGQVSNLSINFKTELCVSVANLFYLTNLIVSSKSQSQSLQ